MHGEGRAELAGHPGFVSPRCPGSPTGAYEPIVAALVAEQPVGPPRRRPWKAAAAAAALAGLLLTLVVAPLHGQPSGRQLPGALEPRSATAAAQPKEGSEFDRQPEADSQPLTLQDAVQLQGLSGSPASMFCFSVVMPIGNDVELVRYQYQQKVSIFRCDDTAVFTNVSSLDLGGVPVNVLKQDLACRPAESAFWAFNAWLFIALWRAVIAHGQWQDHDWTVKVDTDAVFFPERLGFMLERHRGTAYLTNARVGVHAPLQVLSRDAVAALAEDYATSWDGKSPKRCMIEAHELDYGNCTRDSFLDVCLMKVLLSSERTVDPNIACDKAYHCKEAARCGDDRASFHPHETVDDYSACLRNSMGVAGRL